jgi:hypothetical protein
MRGLTIKPIQGPRPSKANNPESMPYISKINIMNVHRSHKEGIRIS